MSAFIVSDQHISALVNWAVNLHGLNAVRYYWNNRSRDVRQDRPQRLASVLHSQNVRSVNYLYDDKISPNDFKFKRISTAYLSPVQIIKACHCLEYQSCETEDWKATEACAILKAIERAAVHLLPGYNDAEWHLDTLVKESA